MKVTQTYRAFPGGVTYTHTAIVGGKELTVSAVVDDGYGTGTTVVPAIHVDRRLRYDMLQRVEAMMYGKAA